MRNSTSYRCKVNKSTLGPQVRKRIEQRKRDEKAAPLERYLSIEQMTLDDLELSVRAYNCLKRADKTTLRIIMAMSKKELSCVRNLGKKSFDEVIAMVNELLFE